jgi:predicted secreted protein
MTIPPAFNALLSFGRPWLRAAIVALSLAAAAPALAVDDGTTTLNVTGTAERQVENDRMTVLLNTEARAPEAATAAAAVNRTMESALERARQHAGIEARTLGYSSRALQDSDDRTEIRAWRVQQSLELAARDFDRLSALVGRLQGEDLSVSQIRFSLSPEARKEHREAMIAEAVADLQAQARAMARSIGASHLRILEMERMDGRNNQPRPLMAARAAESSATRPALEAGHSTLSVRVRGRFRALGAATLQVMPR